MTQRSRQLGKTGEGCQICVSLAAPDEISLKRALGAVQEADLIEVRLDSLVDPLACGESLLRDLQSCAPAPVGFTCRPVWEGGRFEGSEVDRRELLTTAARSGAAFIDVEQDAEWAEALISDSAIPVVLSHHWHSPRPPDLDERARQMCDMRPAVAKLVTEAHSPADAVPVLHAGADMLARGQAARGMSDLPHEQAPGSAGVMLGSVAARGGVEGRRAGARRYGAPALYQDRLFGFPGSG